MSKEFLLAFYVPSDHLEKVLEHIFAAGAGEYKNYDHCAWTSEGDGRFRPLENARPFIGEHGKEEHVKEIKVECFIKTENIHNVKKALLESHPYEEPAYHFIAIQV